MFFTFLNKEEVSYLDLSVLNKFPPENVLFYYYSDMITFSIDTYFDLLDIVDKDKPSQHLLKWYRLLENLEVAEDLEHFKQNEYLEKIGPYYYPATNTRIYFTKGFIAPDNYLTLEDVQILNGLGDSPRAKKDIQAYYKNRRNAKKSAKNKAELLKDINMCIQSFTETEILNRHINFINKLLDLRYSIVEKADLEPVKPDNIPVKPQVIDEGSLVKDNIIPFTRLKRTRKEPAQTNYNFDTKVYFIRYREYEKACDRYKDILANWPDYCQEFLDKCYADIDKTEAKLKKANSLLKIYNFIIQKSYIHADYQDVIILNKFKNYLETGRANNLQECMNLFEDERYWQDIRASQDRIENTIYFLQSETDLTRFADENINKYLKQFNETTAKFDEAND